MKFFEYGNCYKFDKDKLTAELPIKAYSQDYRLALWVTGKRVSGSWAHPDENASFYELKAYVYNIFKRVGLNMSAVNVASCNNDIFSKAIEVTTKAGKPLAQMGIVAHSLQKSCDIDQEIYYAEIDFSALMKAVRKNKIEFKEVSKYPAVSRDLALLIDNNIQFEQIEQIAFQSEKKLLKRVELFDVYQGKNLPEGKKSYAVNFILQDENKTLNDKAIDSIMTKLINNLKNKLGAELR